MHRFALCALASVLPACILLAAPALADEGMWTFDNLPTQALKQKYGVELDRSVIDRLQRAVTRLQVGCTGSFVSPDGLVLTNHHCVARCLSDISSAGANYVADGFHAASRAAERKCPAGIVSTLVGVEDVTAKVNAVTAGLAAAQANDARKQERSRLEAACEAASKRDRAQGPLACESVSLYQGGQYFLYKYRRYDDVRIVFAPHDSIAAFGGDPDNFNFPRWSLDFSLLRVYANGKPLRTPDYLRWRAEGPQAGEPVFVAGHPGTTNRLLTASQLQFQRDVSVPSFLIRNSELRGRLIQWSKTGEEPRRIVQDVLLGYENSLKVSRGSQLALLDDTLLQQKALRDQQLRERVAADPQLAGKIGNPWDDIDAAQTRYRQIYDRYLYLELGAGFNSKSFSYARLLVRGAAERGKKNELRLREYADSNLPIVAANLLAATPVYPQFEELTLSFSLDKLREALGPDDDVVRKLLSKESPDSLAAKLIATTKLADPAVRKALWEGSADSIDTSTDPMIVLAREIDAEARAVRKTYEDEVQAPVATAQEKIAQARFAAYGTQTYPDATFTLRLSYGAVNGWMEKGAEIPPFSKLGRLYERTTGKPPFQLPQIWLDARDKLDPNLPATFVATTDIIGGNSGSPVTDAQGRLVGLAFDGNLHSIAGDYWYDPRLNRTVAVHPMYIIAALRDVYGAEQLARELLGK
jgi:hypothetical protein